MNRFTAAVTVAIFASATAIAQTPAPPQKPETPVAVDRDPRTDVAAKNKPSPNLTPDQKKTCEDSTLKSRNEACAEAQKPEKEPQKKPQ